LPQALTALAQTWAAQTPRVPAELAQALAMLARTRAALLPTALARRASSLARLARRASSLARLARRALALARLMLTRRARAPRVPDRPVPDRPVFSQVLTVLRAPAPMLLAWMCPRQAAALIASRRLRQVPAAGPA
jgi:hypothetical protein